MPEFNIVEEKCDQALTRLFCIKNDRCMNLSSATGGLEIIDNEGFFCNLIAIVTRLAMYSALQTEGTFSK